MSCCVPDNKLNSKTRSSHHLLTKEIFLKVVGDTTRNEAIYYFVVESLDIAKIETEYQIAAYLSQLIGETKFFEFIESSVLEKDDNYLIGNNQTGDGTKFRGRGGIMLRGRDNYELAHSKLSSMFKQFKLI